MRKEGMRQIVVIDPDPTYRIAEKHLRKEARAAERERLAAAQKKRALKAVRIMLEIKTMAKNHDFEIVGHLILRDHNSGREYKEGGIR